MQAKSHRLALIAFSLMIHVGYARAEVTYVQTNLVSNGTVPGTQTDPNMQGAWGMSYSTGSPVWVSDQAANFLGSGATTVYSVSTKIPPTSSSGPLLTVAVPNQGGAPPSGDQTNGPTGQVNTSALGITSGSGDFQVAGGHAAFIFANLDGSISAWRGGLSPSNQAQITATVPGASFTGLAIGNLPGGGAAQIYAADQNSGNIDVINNKWTMTGSFTDPKFASFPAGYAAFNVQMLSVGGVQTLFVTFANQSTLGGIVDEFNTDGTFIKTLINDTAGDHLAGPWGLAIAPTGWGPLGGDLLVGNNNPNADGLKLINAYNLTTGAFAGTLTLNTGLPFSADELWAIGFGNGGSAGSTNTLLFTAGLTDNTGGLLGAITPTPEPSTFVVAIIGSLTAVAARQWKRRRHGFAS